jgi:hypothetical protein
MVRGDSHLLDAVLDNMLREDPDGGSRILCMSDGD